MASKKAGRLAGLAALGLAAYMNKDKLFGAKGETKAAETKAETKAAETKAETKAFNRDTDTGVDVMPSYGDGNAAMFEKEPGFETKTAPAKVARSEKAPSASVTKVPIIGGPTPARDPGGAGKRGAVSVGPTPARAPGGVGKRGGVGDGGQSMVERQNAGAKRAGLSVDDYITSGKKTIDEQDGTFKRGGKVKKMASGGVTSSASKRADGIATKGKTRGRVC